MEALEDIIGGIVPFLFAGLVVFIVFHYRHRRRVEAEQTIRLAIEKGQQLDAAVVEKLLAPPARPHGPGRLKVGGIITTSVGIGFAAMYFIMGKQMGDDGNGLLGAGALIGIIGLGLLVASLLKPQPPQA